MELEPGSCYICNSNSKVVNSSHSKAFWEIVQNIFKEGIADISEDIAVEICPTCIFQICLINSNEEKIQKAISEECIDTAEENCRICENSNRIFKVEHLHLSKMMNSDAILKENCSYLVCADCYYVIEARFNLSKNLMQKCSAIKEKSSIRNGDSTRHSKRHSKWKKNLADGIQTSGVPSSSELSTKQSGRKYRTLDVSLKNPTENNNGESSSHPMEVSKVDIPAIDVEKVTHGRTRKRKASKSPEVDVPSKSKRTKLSQTSSMFGLDFSQFQPLVKSKMLLSTRVTMDDKLYRKIPFVKLQEVQVSLISENNIFSNIFKKKNRSEAGLSPKSAMKKTPPIKIKLKPEIKIKLKRENKESCSKKIASLIEEIRRKQVVVKLARLELSPLNKMDTNNDEMNKKIRACIVSEKKSDMINEITPKKKKKVHFDDTPIIIISEDDFSEEECSSNQNGGKNQSAIIRDVEAAEKENGNMKESSDDTEDAINIIEHESSRADSVIEDAKASRDDVTSPDSPTDSTKLIEKEDTDAADAEIPMNQTCDSSLTSDEKKTLEDKSVGDGKIVNAENSSEEINDKEEHEVENLESSSEVNSASVSEIVDICYKDNSRETQDSELTEKKDSEDSPLNLTESNVDNNDTEQDNPDELSSNAEDKGTGENHEQCKENDENESTVDKIDELSTQKTMEISDKSEEKGDNSNDSIVVSDINLSVETEVNEDFGSLIDEVQMCLNSSKDLSNKSDDEERTADTEEIEKECQNDTNRSLEDKENNPDPVTDNLELPSKSSSEVI